MDIIKFGNQLKTPCVMCLGYFDALHKGHKKLILKGKEIAKNEGLKLAIFLFIGGKNSNKDIFSFEERLLKLKLLGVDFIVYSPLDKEFMSKTKESFTSELFSYYNIKYTVTGIDFRFGKNAEGDYYFLEKTAKNSGIISVYQDEVFDENKQKISSKTIKKLLLDGDILRANQLLDSNYFIRGVVVKGKNLGQKIGYPTANIVLDSQKILIKSGVYLTFTVIESKVYPCLTNVGKQPTVNGDSDVIETYIHGFSGDLYGKKLTVYFVERIRDVVKFQNIKRLKEQLDKDLEVLK